ncbi:glycosyltransferase [Vibrio harveyi]|uniref:glycosyltransferase n=2 Tax=Vibrio harveyi TaxID=669 RepID=UPI00237FDE88|nr:glycosyltransferase [Vibrio harveyi]HDM8058301.1 glycosyltransferase [Vibrio harveyi]
MKKNTSVAVYGLSALSDGHAALYSGLMKYGIECTIIEENFDRSPVDSIVLPTISVKSKFYLKKIFKIIKAFQRFDVIEIYLHKFGLRKELTELLVMLILIFLNKTIIINFTGRDIREWKEHSILKRLIIKVLARRAAFYTLKESYMLDYVKKYSIANKDKHYFIHNGVHNGFKTFQKITREDSVVILFNNRFKGHRNLDFLIKNLEEILNKHNDVFLIISGAKSKQELTEVKTYAKDWSESALSRLLVLELNQHREFIYSQSDIFLMPADVVWLNNSIIESMRYGILPILPNVNWSERIIPKHLRNDSIYEHMNGNDFISKIDYWISNRELLRSEKENIREYVSKNLSSDKRCFLHANAYHIEISKSVNCAEYEFLKAEDVGKYMKYSSEYEVFSLGDILR